MASLGLLLSMLFLKGDTISRETLFGYKLNAMVGRQVFGFLRWEVATILDETTNYAGDRHDKEVVREYFSLLKEMDELRSQGEIKGSPHLSPLESRLEESERRRARLEGAAEEVIEGQVGEVLAAEGFYLPFMVSYRIVFPPVEFEFEKPPLALVISPRERIEIKKQVYLLPHLSLERMEEIEAKVDDMGVSSLVVPVGGLSAYPSMILEGASLDFLLSAVAHEWFHAYLFFNPLGWHYGDSYEMVTMNETVATIAGDEIGGIVLARYWSEEKKAEEKKPLPKAGEEEFDFNQEMRNIRLKVDEYLARGEVEAAEHFMEERREFLANKGHHLRKLNQAYFAFYGSYATSPTSIDPIGQELKELRRRSRNLREFIDTVARMSSRKELRRALE